MTGADYAVCGLIVLLCLIATVLRWDFLTTIFWR